MVRYNFHSHTYRCQHATGTEREYVERAIEAGYKIWGFSDHTPIPYDDGFRSQVRMRMDELEGYVRTVLDLKDEFRSEIDIRLGLEVEYFPKYFDSILRLREQFPIEYMLLGQHFTLSEAAGPYCGRPTTDVSVLNDYRELVLEGMRSGQFLYLAHPDIIGYPCGTEEYTRTAETICLEAKRLGIPLEVNLLGFYDGRHYPTERFWEIAAGIGNDVVIGVDAHAPEQIGFAPAIRKAEALTEKLGLKVLPDFTI